jgi:iron(III) transport system permease protein
VLLLVIAVLGVGPLLWMFFRAASDASLLNALRDAGHWTLLLRTLGLAASVAVVATALGAFFGYRLGATDWPGKPIVRALLLLPLAIPPYLHGIGWTTLMRPDGIMTGALARLWSTPPHEISGLLYSFGGAVFVLSVAYFPIAVFFVEKSLAWSSPSLVEAAQVCGAGPWSVFLVARWPAIRTAVGSAALITFLLAASDLGVPTLLNVRVFNTEVFTQLSAFNDVNAATLLMVPLLLVGLFAVWIVRGVTLHAQVQPDTSDVERPSAAGSKQVACNIVLFTAVLSVFLGLPIGAVILQGANLSALRSMTALAATPAYNSAIYAGCAAAVVALVSLGLAGTLRRAPLGRQLITDAVVIVGFAVPSTVLALALLGIFSSAEASAWFRPTALVVLALVLRFLIVGYRIVAGGLAQIPDDLLDWAVLGGAGPWQRFRRVTLPMLRLPLLSTFAVVFVLAWAEIGSTILLYPPGGETILIAFLSIEANSPRAYVGAMTMLQLLPVIFIFGLGVTVLVGSERAGRPKPA